MRAIYGQKKLMTRIFDEKGQEIPVTIVDVGKNLVTRIKTEEKDGYQAVQIGAGKARRINKPLTGQLKKLEIKPAVLFEIKTDKELAIGQELNLDEFKENEKVYVTAISKGKGFAGTVKRHKFHTGPKTHGSNNYRQPGSIGDTGPQRVVKGKRMAGQKGGKKTTIKNLEIYKIEKEIGRIYLKGTVPGANKNGVLIWSRQ